jgi:hypothetical protein
MDPIEFMLTILVIVYLGIFSVHILYKCTKLEPQLKYYHYGLAFFAIAFMLARIFFLFNDLVFEVTLDPADKQGLFYVLGSISSSFAVFGIMFVVEKYIIKKRLKFIPSIIILIFAVLIIVLPKIDDTNMITLYTTVSSAMAVLIPILYISVGFQVSGHTKKKSFLLAIAIIIVFLGNLSNMGQLKTAFPIFRIISPLTILIGFVIFHYGLLIY